MKQYNVTVLMWFEAENKEDAEARADNAMSAILKGNEPLGYEVEDVCEDRSA